MKSWNKGWLRTTLPGVYESEGDPGTYRVRVRVLDLETGKLREANRIQPGITLVVADKMRDGLRLALRERVARRKVADFANDWLANKTPLLEPHTASRYNDALNDHALMKLGHLQFDRLRSMHVQNWVNWELQQGYRVATVKGWFRVFRTMTRDAMEYLDLAQDPTRRVHFPNSDGRSERNSLRVDELRRFLAEMRVRYPHNYALTATLAFTGLRFCHASALRWEDVDEKAGVLRVSRKQVRGHVGPTIEMEAGAQRVSPSCSAAHDLTDAASAPVCYQSSLATSWVDLSEPCGNSSHA